jgi:hypothetical protein
VSRRRHDHAPKTHGPALTSTEDFSDQELDFFKRGDELHPPASDSSDSGDADA